MMRLEEVGKVPEDQIAIQRMVVSTCPSLLSFQLSFHQCLLRFFLNHFLGIFRDFTDDDDDDSFKRDIKSSSDQLSDSFSSDSDYLIRWSFHHRRCENGCHGCSMGEEPVSCSVLFELCHNCHLFC